MNTEKNRIVIWAYRLLFLSVITSPMDANFLQYDVAGFTVRIYQVLFLVTGVLFFASMPKLWLSTLVILPRRIFSMDSLYLRLYDYLLVGIFLTSLVGGLLFTEDYAFTGVKTAIFASFLAVYFLVRYAIRDVDHLKGVVKALLFGHFLVLLLGVYQAIAFKLGWGEDLHLMIMEGRVNSLLYEPDWLGVWSATIVGLLLPFFYGYHIYRKRILLFLYLSTLVMLVSISRSGWVASIAVVGVFFFFKFANKQNPFKIWFQRFVVLLVTVGLAIGTVQGVELTPFNLQNRFISIFTQQDIAQVQLTPEGDEVVISEEEAEEIRRVEEETGQRARISVKGVQDENVTRRINSFWESINLITQNPVFGVGPGGVEEEFGEGINTSNIFLGVGTKSGVVGMILFIGIVYLLFKQGWFILQFDAIWGWAMILSAMAFLTANMFNDGFFLGFFWVFLAVWSRIPDFFIPEEFEEDE